MKILMITPYLPYPPSSGGQVRSYNLIKNLAGKDEITLFALIKQAQERNYVKELEKYCRKVRVFNRPAKAWTLRNILRTGLGTSPFLVVRNFSPEAKNALEKELKENKYDLIHAETFYVMPHLPQTSTPVLLVEQTIEYRVYAHFVESLPSFLFFLKPILNLDVLKLRWWEKYYWQKADHVVAVSEADKEKMLKLVDDLKVSIVSNGAGEDLMSAWQERCPAEKPLVLFQANFSWLQNVEAARYLSNNVFPLIKREIPEAEGWIVGQGAAQKIAPLTKNGLRVVDINTGDIKTVVDAYRKSTVFVSPLQGPGGTRLKILAAMAAGVPVVTTSVGIEGISARDGKEVLIRDSWPAMAKAAIKLIKDRKLHQRLTWAARKLIEDKYSYQSIAALLHQIYEKVANEQN